MKQLLILSVISLALVGCGGGGSDTGSQVGSSAAIDKYIGTWQRGCTTDDDDIRQSSDGAATHTTLKLDFTKLNSTSANTQLTFTVYANKDRTCQGPAIGSVVMTGLNTSDELYGKDGNISTSLGQNVLTFVETVTLASGEKVDRLTLKTAKFAGLQGTVKAGAIQVDTRGLGEDNLRGLALVKADATLVLDLDDDYPSELTADQFTTFSKK
jgi:hypothetical protein